jgi:hypothetical protein
LGITYFYQTLTALPPPTEGIFLKTIMSGVLFGLIAIVLIEALRWATSLVARVTADYHVTILLPAVIHQALRTLSVAAR